jgi:putative flippase GtrA
MGPVAGTAWGAAAGALTNFALGRHWIFEAHERAWAPQALRYAAVSAASLGLNAAGEYLLAVRLGVAYIAARALTAVVVSLVWNLPMQRRFVFPAAPEATP